MIKDLGRVVGFSAYEVAVQNGYEGTETEWLLSLVGKNAYEVAVQNGFTGTQAQWLDSLNSKVLSITKATSGNTNTYTMTFSNGNTQSFTVQNGKEISSIEKQSSTVTDSTLLFTYNDGTTETVTIPNGNGIASIAKTNTNGIIDTYTITYTNGTTSTFQLRNSIDTVPHDYTDELTDSLIYIAGRVNQAGGVTVNIGDTLPRGTNNDFKHDTDSRYRATKISVNGGQMFRITATVGNTNPIYTVVDSDDVLVARGFGESVGSGLFATENEIVTIEKDGYLLVNVRNDYPYSIKKVTLFNEVETAINSIPDTDELVAAVIEALPRAEEGAF